MRLIMREKRIKRLRIAREGLFVLLKMARTGFKGHKLSLPFPEDAEPISVQYDFERDCFWFYLYHPSYEVIEQGFLVPEIEEPIVVEEEEKQDEG